MTERSASERALGALKAIGMDEAPITTLEREDALFVLTGQTLVYQDGGGTRRVTLRDLTRIHSDEQGMLRVETPAGTALTASLLGFDVPGVQAFFAQVRDTTARAKELPVSPLPTPGALKTFGSATAAPRPEAGGQGGPRAPEAPATGSAPTRAADTPPGAAPTDTRPPSPPLSTPSSPAPASPASVPPPRPHATGSGGPSAGQGAGDAGTGVQAADPADTDPPARAVDSGPAATSPGASAERPAPPASPSLRPRPVPDASTTSPALSPPGSGAPAGAARPSAPPPEPAPARPVVISSSAFTPTSARAAGAPPAPAAAGGAAPRAAASSAAPSSPVPSPPAAPVPALTPGSPATAPLAGAPAADVDVSRLDGLHRTLARQADLVDGLVGRLRFLGGVLFVAALLLALVQFTAGGRLDALWTLLSGGVGTIALLALAELARLLALLGRSAALSRAPDVR